MQAAVGSGVEDVREVRQRLVSLETVLIKKQRQEDKRGLDLLQKLSEQEVQASPCQSPLQDLHSICTATGVLLFCNLAGRCSGPVLKMFVVAALGVMLLELTQHSQWPCVCP